MCFWDCKCSRAVRCVAQLAVSANLFKHRRKPFELQKNKMLICLIRSRKMCKDPRNIQSVQCFESVQKLCRFCPMDATSIHTCIDIDMDVDNF